LIKEDETGRPCGAYRRDEKCRTLTIHEVKRPLGTLRYNGMIILKINLKDMKSMPWPGS
jgi:hypothetical protein